MSWWNGASTEAGRSEINEQRGQRSSCDGPEPPAWSENNRRVQGHEETGQHHQPVKSPVGTVGTSPQDDDIGEPHREKDVVEVETAAPVDSRHACRLGGRLLPGGRVAPVVVEMEGGQDMHDQQQARDGPEPAPEMKSFRPADRMGSHH